MGHYNLSLSGLVQGKVCDEWYILNGTKSGEIHLRTMAHDFGLPASAPKQQAGHAAGGGYPPQPGGAPMGYPGYTPQTTTAPAPDPAGHSAAAYPPQAAGGYPGQHRRRHARSRPELPAAAGGRLPAAAHRCIPAAGRRLPGCPGRSPGRAWLPRRRRVAARSTTARI